VQPLLAVFAIHPSRARHLILAFTGEKCAAVVTTDRYVGYAFIDPAQGLRTKNTVDVVAVEKSRWNLEPIWMSAPAPTSYFTP
jgi:hypothetical protein